MTLLALISAVARKQNKAVGAQASLGGAAAGERGAAGRTHAGLGGRGRAVVVRGARHAASSAERGLVGASGAGHAFF